MPDGIGIPSAMPIGIKVATATRIRAGRENGIAHSTMGSTTRTTATASSAMHATTASVDIRSLSAPKRRLNRAPIPVPRSSENNVTVSEYTG